jgi:hypothetical protein
VGAAIAAGNQAEKGTCALLVLAATNKRSKHPSWAPQVEGAWAHVKKFQLPKPATIAIEKRMRTSPMRLVSAVKRPALKDFVL